MGFVRKKFFTELLNQVKKLLINSYTYLKNNCLFNLGPLPLGYSFEAKRNSEETHQLPIPSGQQAPDNTEQVFNDLVAFLLVVSVEIKTDHAFDVIFLFSRKLAQIHMRFPLYTPEKRIWLFCLPP